MRRNYFQYSRIFFNMNSMSNDLKFKYNFFLNANIQMLSYVKKVIIFTVSQSEREKPIPQSKFLHFFTYINFSISTFF